MNVAYLSNGDATCSFGDCIKVPVQIIFVTFTQIQKVIVPAKFPEAVCKRVFCWCSVTLSFGQAIFKRVFRFKVCGQKSLICFWDVVGQANARGSVIAIDFAVLSYPSNAFQRTTPNAWSALSQLSSPSDDCF
ncbi:hypothetical protein [Roseobacter sp. EG26]|uniref:hypothetical protein n=1 Tax=Roseobacter sp. EG26 TaxID=3412477 RepID=UPI003CE5B3CB